MRRPERIPIVIELFDKNNLWEKTGIKFSNNNREEFLNYWKSNPDQRLWQCAYNCTLVENDTLYFKEETDYLLENKYCNVEDICFWGRNFDKDDNRLPTTEYVLLKDITPDHAKNILKWFKEHNRDFNPEYKKYFKKLAK